MLKYKQGAASFYIVAISTLILVVIATSFASVIIAAINRSANDELSQSAYDSALAGVEEAKLAYANYRNCLNIKPSLINSVDKLNESAGLNKITCEDIVYWVQHPDGDVNNPSYNPCDMVALILGRKGKTGNSSRDNKKAEIGEVNLEQAATTNSSNTTSALDQAYTCVKFRISPDSIVEGLNSANPYKIVKVVSSTNNNTGTDSEEAMASSVNTVTLKWHLNDKTNPVYKYSELIDNRVPFYPKSIIDASSNEIKTYLPNPPIISFQIVQSPVNGFTFEELNGPSNGSSTNHATMYFVPVDGDNTTSINSTSNIGDGDLTYKDIYNATNDENYLSAEEVASTNDLDKNYPYLVHCTSKNEYACSVNIDLPKPIGSDIRSNEVFYFITSIAYGGPDTVYSIRLICNNGKSCNFMNAYESSTEAPADRDQIIIDSTGRAGDMYKRIETFLKTEVASSLSGYPFYAIQANTISKTVNPTTEWGIDLPEPEPSPGPIDDSCPADTPYMQDWNNANTLAIEQTITLRDKRDDQCYTVAKLKDGKVWMTENLNIAGGTTLSPSDTDMTFGYTLPTENGFLSGNRLPDSSLDSFNSTSNAAINESNVGVYNSGNTDCSSGAPCYSYYSWTAATLGSAIGKYGWNVDATQSICPKGWRLPRFRSVGGGGILSQSDVYQLKLAYGAVFQPETSEASTGASALFAQLGPGTVANLQLSGNYNGGTSSGGAATFYPGTSGALYYTATLTYIGADAGQYNVTVGSLNIATGANGNDAITNTVLFNNIGYPIRCIKR